MNYVNVYAELCKTKVITKCKFIKGGGNAFTVEPHLYEFTALKSLEREGEESNVGDFRFSSKPEAFDYACKTFKAIVEKIVK